MKTTTKTTIGLSLAFLSIVVVGIAFVSSMGQLLDSTGWVRHTMEVRHGLDRLSTTYMQAQTNIRGFYLTGQDHYLQIHKDGIQHIPEQIEHLRSLIKDNPQQVIHFESIVPLIQRRMDQWESSIDVRREKGIEAITTPMQGQDGKLTDFRIRKILEDMQVEEKRLFEDRQQNAVENATFTKLVSFVGGGAALLFIVLAVFIVHRDARKRAQAEMELDRFFSLSLDLLCIAGFDGYFKRLSPAFCDLLGFSLKELYRTPLIEFIHPADRDKSTKEIERQVNGHKVQSFENRFRCKDGSYKTLSWKSVPIDGTMYAVARDVTVQREYENELVSARELAQEGTRAKSDFLANMSHEIRTPLNGIIGMADLMSKTALNSEQKEQVDILKQSGQHLLKVINEVLDYSKIEAGRMNIELLNFNLSQVFAAQVSLIGVTAHEKNLKLHSLVDPKIPDVIRGDAGRIGQVLLNLLGNAVKFTPAGTITVKANLETIDESSCWIRFSVTDTGIGMTGEQMGRLFNPFSQADNSTSRRYGGTGLGLSISKRLVELMGGVMGVESNLRLGSTFWFKLKFEVPQAGNERVADSVPVTKGYDPGDKALHVLVAEDNFVNQLIITKMLEKLGCAAHVVANGEEAVKAFTENAYDIVFMDFHMPLMDGSEATKHIRELEKSRGKRTPILAFTANVFPEDQAKCLAAGMDDFILKPVTIANLEKSLNKWTDAVAS